ncbi:MAG: FMN-binding negative transcriptional regulator [Myxococcales bacterium]|nr:FMN-binding negative transcriptional regulator [Myxococcales bacterium]
MYRPPAPRADDPVVAYEIIDAHPFATLTSVGRGGDPVASHIPVLRQEDHLLFHVARANPQAMLGGGRALVIFNGPDAYVSPTWYGRPAEHVPTWNYVAVHVWGRVEALSDPESALALNLLVERFEASWTVGDAVRDRLVGAIVGFRLVPDRIEAKLKLSQNRDELDAVRVSEVLRRNEPALATWMSRVLRRG